MTVWDEEVMNDFRGWPQSCFADQNRLGFTNFPRVPPGVSWSAINTSNDLYVPTEQFLTPDNAIFELAPGKSQVMYVLAGAECDEFVFCDNAVYWIPINVQNPLSGDRCHRLQQDRRGRDQGAAAGVARHHHLHQRPRQLGAGDRGDRRL